MMANVKHSQARLHQVLELVSDGVLTAAAQARGVGCTPATIREWKLRSTNGEPEFEVEYGGQRMQWARAYRICERHFMLDLRAKVTEFAAGGRRIRTLAGGQFVVALDPAAIPLTVEQRILCGFHPDALALDPITGHATFVETIEHAPIGLVMPLLQAAFDDLKTTVNSNVNIKGQLSLGVGIVKAPDYSKPAPQIPPMPPMPELEILPPDDDGLAELLGPEPQPVMVASVEQPPDPVVEQPILQSIKPPTQMVLDLLARAHAPVADPERTKPIPERGDGHA